MYRNIRLVSGTLICFGLLMLGGLPAGHGEGAAGAAGSYPTKPSENIGSGEAARPPAYFPSTNPLAGTIWRLVGFQSMDDAIGSLHPDDPLPTLMQLESEGTAMLRINCHRVSGTWSALPGGSGSSGSFEFGPLETTRGLCSLGPLEARLETDATYIRSYVLKDGRLYLSLMADGGIYAWEPVADVSASAAVPPAPEEGGPRNWKITGVTTVLNLREQPSTAAQVVSRLPSGILLDNLGCQRVDDQVWCQVQPLGGGARGYVSALYLIPAVAPDGSVATGPDDSALRAGQGQFDATGQIACAKVVDQPMKPCDFGIARAGGGYATVIVKKPDGTSRAIFFRMGQPIGADTSEAEGKWDFRTRQENGLHLIRVGDERYEIPDALLLDG